MSAVLFLGPSLPAAEARAAFGEGELHLLGPATQGDLLRSLSLRPRAVGLVDGRFDGEPAVLHKEILQALQGGVTVFGAASMGALRAAELHTFGMVGVGAIFTGFRDGELQADDEVALLHAGPEHGHQPLSEALVDIRATLGAAVADGVLNAEQAHTLLAAARALHYPQRQWPTLLDLVDPPASAALGKWLPGGRRSQKREDALLLVAALREAARHAGPAPVRDWRLQRSHFWEDYRARQGASSAAHGAALDELRLLPGEWRQIASQALLRLLSRREASRLALTPSAEDTAPVLDAFRQQHRLHSREALNAWLAENGVDTPAIEAALHDDAQRVALFQAFGAALEEAVLVEAALAGRLTALRERACRKRELLDEQGLAAGAVPGNAQLLGWYFREHRGEDPPADLDAFARTLGLIDREEFLHLLAREYLYCRSEGAAALATSATREKSRGA